MASPESARFYRSPEWKALRQACLARDRYLCVAPGCGATATHVDHIRTRPHAASLTSADVLSNLRSLCASHDAQVKEGRGGRNRSGAFSVRGAAIDGWPIDFRRNR